MDKTPPSLRQQQGAAVLVLTIMLMVVVLLMAVYTGQNGVLRQKSVTNSYASAQAFQAAEAGLSFGIVYLNQNISTVTGSPSGGFINYGASDTNLTNVSLANGAKFCVVITNPTANNYQTLTITSTGTSVDGTATETVSQQFYQGVSYINASAMSRGNVTFVGGSTLTNTITNINIMTGGTLTINNGAATYTSSGFSSTQGNIKSDVQQNVSSLATTTESAFFQTVFGTSKSNVQASAQATSSYYNNTVAGGDYSQTLKGVTGKTIYINQSNGNTVTLGQGVTIGSASSPVTLVVDGNLNIANGVTIYGFVYSSAPTSAGFALAGGARITGGIASGGTLNISNGFQLTYTKYPILVGSSSGGYSEIAGSWIDFPRNAGSSGGGGCGGSGGGDDG